VPSSQPSDTGSVSASTSAPATSASPEFRQLWIRFHPISHAEVWGALRSAITSTLIEIRNEQAATRARDVTGKGKGKERDSDDRPEVQIELSDRRGEVNAFEIMGPKSARVLKGALGGLVKDERRAEMKQVSIDRPRFGASSRLRNKPGADCFDGAQIWNELGDLKTSGSMPRGMVLGLKVYDPRLR
jgi:ribonuclease P/MRP protein subunit POP1